MRARQTLFTLLVAGFALVPALARADDLVLKRFDIGREMNAVGMVDASEDTEVEGPQAIYAGEKGEIYLLDRINGRILTFDRNNPDAPTRSLQLPPDLQQSDVTDLVVMRGDIYVWSGEIRALRATGPDDGQTRGLEEYSTRADDTFVASAFAQMGSQRPEGDTDLLEENTRSAKPRGRTAVKQSIASRGKGAVVASIIPDRSEAAVRIEVQQRDEGKRFANLQLRVPNRLGVVEFLEIDRSGRMFVLAENIPPAGGDLPTTFVARYAASGQIEGVHELPLSQNVTNVRRFVTVDADGDVYFLRTRKGGAEVVGVGMRRVRGNQILTSRQTAAVVDPHAKGTGPLAAVRPLTRQRVIEAAFAFEGITWTLSQANYGRDPDSSCTGFNRVRRPAYLQGKAGQQVRGIPYCWGCMGSLTQIKQRLDRGMLAGNWCTHNDPRRDVVGVDCSAFVSATWGLATHFTTRAIPGISSRIDASSMLPGDALNRPGSHVMLFLRYTPDRKVEVMEAATGGCNGRVCRNVYQLGALMARGYTPVRYRGLVSETTAQAQIAYPDQKKEAPKAAKAVQKAPKNKRQKRRQ